MNELTPDARVAIDQTTKIVSSYVNNNPVSPDNLAKLLTDVHAAVTGLYHPVGSAESAPAQEPAIPPRSIVKPDSIGCLECGVRLKSLRRHIGAKHGMTIETYYAKWGLKPDVPLVAPSYSEVRSKLAKANGLGKKG